MSRAQHRDRQKEQFWHEAVTAWQKSGLSVRAFCAGRGLAEPSFYSWRRELARRAQGRAKSPARPRLVPVRVVADALLEVVLPSGVVVRVPAAADAAAVAKLVAALGAPAC